LLGKILPLTKARVVSLKDPALDMDVAARIAYNRSPGDASLVRTKEGHTPTWFWVRALSEAEYDECQINAFGAKTYDDERGDYQYLKALNNEIFFAGCELVESWARDGVRVEGKSIHELGIHYPRRKEIAGIISRMSLGEVYPPVTRHGADSETDEKKSSSPTSTPSEGSSNESAATGAETTTR